MFVYFIVLWKFYYWIEIYVVLFLVNLFCKEFIVESIKLLKLIVLNIVFNKLYYVVISVRIVIEIIKYKVLIWFKSVFFV